MKRWIRVAGSAMAMVLVSSSTAFAATTSGCTLDGCYDGGPSPGASTPGTSLAGSVWAVEADEYVDVEARLHLVARATRDGDTADVHVNVTGSSGLGQKTGLAYRLVGADDISVRLVPEGPPIRAEITLRLGPDGPPIRSGIPGNPVRVALELSFDGGGDLTVASASFDGGHD